MSENKEIDLISLITNLIIFIRKYILIIVIFLTVGLALGILNFYFGRNYYRTNLIASSPVVNNQIIFEIAEPIKYFVLNDMADSVACQLDIDVEIAKSIKKMDLDTSINRAVLISLDVYDKDNIDIIQTGIINYFNNIPYIKSTIVKRRLELENYISLLDKEIEDINLMQKAVLNSINDETSDKMVSVGGLFSEIVVIYEKKIELEDEYNSLNAFTLVNNNLVFIAQKSLKKNLMIYGFFGLIIGIFVCGVLEIRKRINNKK